MAKSGRSKTQSLPHGKRRKDEEGKKIAPRSVRQNTDKHYLKDCTDYEIKEYTGMNPEDVRNPKKHSSW